MTKAQRIMRLYDGKRTTNEIAGIVGCLPEYVRVVARQRKDGRGMTPSDRKWWDKSGRKQRRERYARDAEFRERALATNARWRMRKRQEARA